MTTLDFIEGSQPHIHRDKVVRLRLHLTGAILAVDQFLDATGVDVEAERRQLTAELDGQRKTDLAETDDGDLGICRKHWGHETSLQGSGVVNAQRISKMHSESVSSISKH